MLKLFAVVFFIHLHFFVTSQYWGANTTSTYTNEAIDVESDLQGNQYVTGYITGETSFDINTVQTSAAGNGDIYVAKYSPQGALIWIQQFGGNYSDRPTDLVIDQSNSIYVTGQYFGQVTFGATTLNSVANSKDIFILKLNNSGTVIWAHSEGGAGSENAYGLATDSQNNLLLTGQFSGNSILNGAPYSSSINPVTSDPSYDLFISKYNSSGTPLWIQIGFSHYEDRGLAVHCDNQNNIFFTGQFSDTLHFAGSTINNTSFNLGFLCKLLPNGQLSWLNKLKGGTVMPYDLEVNNDNEIVVTGDFTGNSLIYQTLSGNQTLTNSYSKKIFALKTSNSGSYIWGTTLGSDSDISARAISIDATKNSYITGYFKCNLTQIHDTNSSIFNSVGFKDVYLFKIDNLGSFVSIKQFGGKENDEGTGISFLPSQEPIICGSYTNNLTIPYDYNSSYFTIPITNFELNNVSSEPFVYLHGDNSTNSFLTNAIHPNTPQYNYFYNQPPDSLIGYINTPADTFLFCVADYLAYLPLTYYQSGPAYNYLWNTSETTDTIFITQTGIYSVFVDRKDHCISDVDSLFAVRHELPPLPLLTDNLGIAVNEPGPNYAQYYLCSPDSVEIWYNNLCAGCSIEIYNIQTGQTHWDTLAHYYNQEHEYDVTIQDSFCTNNGYYFINVDTPVAYTPIQPYLFFVEDFDSNDTITICANENINVHVYDYLNNPNATLNLFNPQVNLDSAMFISPSIGSAFSQLNLSWWNTSFPQTTGWYVYNFKCSLGYDNTCGLDTISYSIFDSIYIIVNPLPSAFEVIQADNLLCPNGSAYLYVSNPLPGFSWLGNGISWISGAADSIQVTESGLFHYTGTLIDPITGCQNLEIFDFQLNEKIPPTIIMQPLDGIICPYDTVEFYLPNTYLSYEWVDPNGINGSTTNIAFGEVQGFYYCEVLDAEGCYLTTLPVEVKEYSTPSISVEPSTVLCSGDFATISVSYVGDVQIQWTTPFLSNNDTLLVNQPGFYVCQIDQCGITTMDSIELIDGSFSLSISATDSSLCYNENAIITTDVGYNNYDWSNGENGQNSIFATEPGSYFVIATNQFGCETSSDTIIITTITSSIPPDLSNVQVCSGSTATLNLPNNAFLNWYTADSVFIQNSASFVINSILNDTLFLAAFNVPTCPPAYSIILITIADSLTNLTIVGDTLLCLKQSSEYSIYTINNETINWYVSGIQIGDTNSIEYTSSGLLPEILMATVSNGCYTDTLYQTVNTITPNTISAYNDTLILCNYETYPITMDGIYDSLIWTYPSGLQFDGDTVFVTTQLGNGILTVQGIDSNGCATNSAAIELISSNLSYSLYQNSNFNCMLDTIQVSAITSTDSLIWQTPVGTSTSSNLLFELNNQTAGWYSIELWDEIGCIYNDSIFVAVNQNPMLSMSSDTILCLNSWMQIENLDSVNYSWEGIGITDSIPVVMNSWYYVTAINQFGCAVSDSIFIQAINCSDDLPNVITSNGDGINDYLIIDDALVFGNNKLLILNRWGELIFEMSHYDNTFNGVEFSEGVYFYTFIYDVSNPETQKKEGFIHLFH